MDLDVATGTRINGYAVQLVYWNILYNYFFLYIPVFPRNALEALLMLLDVHVNNTAEGQSWLTLCQLEEQVNVKILVNSDRIFLKNSNLLHRWQVVKISMLWYQSYRHDLRKRWMNILLKATAKPHSGTGCWIEGGGALNYDTLVQTQPEPEHHTPV